MGVGAACGVVISKNFFFFFKIKISIISFQIANVTLLISDYLQNAEQ